MPVRSPVVTLSRIFVLAAFVLPEPTLALVTRPDPQHTETHCTCSIRDMELLQTRNGIGIEFVNLDARGNTMTCDTECLRRWEICEERYCCPADMLDDIRDDGRWGGSGRQRMRETLKKIRKGEKWGKKRCRSKEVGPDPCEEEEAVACYWRDLVGPPYHCLTWNPTGGEMTNFYVPLTPGEEQDETESELEKILGGYIPWL